MKKQYNWAIEQLEVGRKVRVFKGLGKSHIIRDIRRLSLVGDVLHVDGKPMAGYSVCLA